MIPTVDTFRTDVLMTNLINAKERILFMGETGVGKSMAVQALLKSLNADSFKSLRIHLGYYTDSMLVQTLVEDRLTKRGNKLIVKEANKNLVVCLDDINLPVRDT